MPTAAIRIVTAVVYRLIEARTRRYVRDLAPKGVAARLSRREWEDVARVVERLRRLFQSLLAQFTANARECLPQVGFRAFRVAE